MIGGDLPISLFNVCRRLQARRRRISSPTRFSAQVDYDDDDVNCTFHTIEQHNDVFQ